MLDAHGLEPGQQWGKYLVRRVIGRGGMGVVYLAVDVNLDREVALKLVRPSMSADEALLRQFKQEARAVARLSHAHIVHINSFDQLDDRLLIEMNYMAGGSLRERLLKGVSLGELLRTLEQILMALDCCHSADIIHRDVKPANILYSDDGSAMLSDFGAARLAQSDWQSTMLQGDSAFVFMGTPQYACPESWDGGEPSPQWDIYSLGMVIREAIVGEPLYTAATPYAFLRQVMDSPVTPLQNAANPISEDLSALLDAMVAKRPKDRPESAQLCLAALRRTPEFSQAGGSDRQTILVQRRPSAARRSLWRSKWLRPALQWAVPALVVVGAIVVSAMAIDRSAPPEAARPAAPSGPAESPVAARRPGPERIALTLPHPDNPGRGYLRAEPGGDGWRVVLLDNTKLIHAYARPDSVTGQYHLEGHWASVGSSTRYGTVVGTAAWDPAREDLLGAEFTLVSDTDPATWTERMSALLVEAEDADAWLCRAFDRHPSTWATLYNELLPRAVPYAASLGELLWESALLANLVIRAHPCGTPIALDGLLDEMCWLGAAVRQSEVDGHMGSLRVVATEQGLALGIAAHVALEDSWELRMRLLPRHELVASRQEQFEVTLSKDGGAVLASQQGNGEWRPLETGLSYAVQPSAGGVTAEILISWDALKLVIPEVRSAPVKLCVKLFAGPSPTTMVPVARWGAADEHPVSEGLWLSMTTEGATP